jgi:hypothetical protein
VLAAAATSTVSATATGPTGAPRPTSGTAQVLAGVVTNGKSAAYAGMTRAELFEEFKRDQGKELSKSLFDAKGACFSCFVV